LAQTEVPPAVIFVTAYEEHALQAFESSAVDYLLKPIRRRRLQQALRRTDALTRPQLQAITELQQTTPDYISANYRGGVRRIPLNDIIFFRAHQKYVTLCHIGGEMLLEEALKTLEQQYADRFLRIHRNAIVNKARLLGLEKRADGKATVVLADTDQRLEISRRHQAEVRRWLKK
ncbi:MAG: response regulator transcription factor, partial [Ketobacter sp.]|nr:response regulator transcription factor [Ketobacter sp.]